MKNCKRRTIFSWIFAFVLLIPMFSIAIRCLYVTFNKNAYQSYSADQSLNYTLVGEQSTLESDIQYQFRPNRDVYVANILQYVYVKDFIAYTSTSLPNNIYRFRVYYNANNQSYTLQVDGDTSVYVGFGSYNTPSTLVINFISDREQTNTNYLTNIYKFDYSQQQSLDNVFEYSIQKFVDKHGNGLINFFALLQDYFMQSTTANTLYFTFANWCLNYVLLVSCVWLLFSVLMWFINYCNYMLNTSFRKGHGD